MRFSTYWSRGIIVNERNRRYVAWCRRFRSRPATDRARLQALAVSTWIDMVGDATGEVGGSAEGPLWTSLTCPGRGCYVSRATCLSRRCIGRSSACSRCRAQTNKCGTACRPPGGPAAPTHERLRASLAGARRGRLRPNGCPSSPSIQRLAGQRSAGANARPRHEPRGVLGLRRQLATLRGAVWGVGTHGAPVPESDLGTNARPGLPT